MRILIQSKLSEHMYKTPEGYLVCVDSVIGRTGKQDYKYNEVFTDSDDETIIQVNRLPEDVLNDKTLASFENKPFVNEHPDEDVNPTNFKKYVAGFVRDVHKGYDDGEPVMLATIVVTDEETINDIESGKKRELSCGYDCEILDKNNPCQKNIRGNHVALCEKGRAGIARIVDSNQIKDGSTQRFIFKEVDLLQDLEWWTPKGNAYVYKDNGKYVFESAENNSLGKKYLFNSLNELNNWLKINNDSCKDFAFNKNAQVVPEHQNYYNDWNEKELRQRLIKADSLEEEKILNGLLQTLIKDIETDLMNQKLDRTQTINHYFKYLNMLKSLRLKNYQNNIIDVIANIQKLGIKDSCKDINTEEEVSKKLKKEFKNYNEDAMKNKPITVTIKFDNNYEATEALKTLKRTEDFIDSNLIFDDTIQVKTTDVLLNNLKNKLKFYFIEKIDVKDYQLKNDNKNETNDSKKYVVYINGHKEEKFKTLEEAQRYIAKEKEIDKREQEKGYIKQSVKYEINLEDDYNKYLVSLETVLKNSENIAKSLNLPINKFAKYSREDYVKTVYNSYIRALKPSYDNNEYILGIKNLSSKIEGNLYSWYANTINIKEDAPREWQQKVDNMIDKLFKEKYKVSVKDMLNTNKVNKLISIVKRVNDSAAEAEKAINNLGYTVKKWIQLDEYDEIVAIIDPKYIKIDGYDTFNARVRTLNKGKKFAWEVYADGAEIVFSLPKFKVKDSKTKDASLAKSKLQVGQNVKFKNKDGKIENAKVLGFMYKGNLIKEDTINKSDLEPGFHGIYLETEDGKKLTLNRFQLFDSKKKIKN